MSSLGHIAKMSRSKKGSSSSSRLAPGSRRGHRTDFVGQPSHTGEGSDSGSEDLPMMNIQVVKPTSAKMGIMLDLTLDGNPVQMELDTGASLSIISEKMWRSNLQVPVLAQSRVQLRTYTG